MHRSIALAAALLPVLPALVSAQWANIKTPGVPRTADGKPVLTAPAPRTADGKTDFTGIWAPIINRKCPPRGCDDFELTNEFFNLGSSLKGGLPYQPWAADLVKARVADNGREDPTSQCLPPGIAKSHTLPLLRKIVQLPNLMLILSERETSFRQIFIDGRALPADPAPTYNGYSTAKWDGDTLVVESNGFKDGTWLDRDGNPLTEAAKMTERYRRPNFGSLDIEVTVDDPKAYTRPWTITLHDHIIVDTELIDYYCIENEKDAPHEVGK